MPIARITGQGLFAIAFSVALLWSCLIGERVLVHRAIAERTQVLRQIQQLQRHRRPIPVLNPAPGSLRRPRVTVG